MRILVTGATGYIGRAVAGALLTKDHEVMGLARSNDAARAMREHGITPVMGDFADLARLAVVVAATEVDAVVSTASVGASAGDTAATFARDRDAVRAIQASMNGGDRTLVFTSGSAVFGVFNRGEATDVVYDEESPLPLRASTFAPPDAGVDPMLASGFAEAMSARAETEQMVCRHTNVKGIVIRPGLVYGDGGSYDIPALISRARTRGRAVHLGGGGTIQGYVHLDDLAELYCLAIEKAPRGSRLHGIAGEITQRELAIAVNQMLGVDGRPDSVTMTEMLGLSVVEGIGLGIMKRLPPQLRHRLGNALEPPAGVGSGISLSLNKRLSATRTRQLLGWRPARTDILEDIATGSYARSDPPKHPSTISVMFSSLG
ncbi:MAG: NAD-dependent epimerase/dehydratase family protein [Solirubrobacteraceae bacterium]